LSFYLIFRKFFAGYLTLALTALYAVTFFVVRYSRFAWNPNSQPFFLMLFLLVSSVNAQVLINPEKLPANALNFMVANDMGKRGVSEQKNIATLA